VKLPLQGGAFPRAPDSNRFSTSIQLALVLLKIGSSVQSGHDGVLDATAELIMSTLQVSGRGLIWVQWSVAPPFSGRVLDSLGSENCGMMAPPLSWALFPCSVRHRYQ